MSQEQIPIKGVDEQVEGGTGALDTRQDNGREEVPGGEVADRTDHLGERGLGSVSISPSNGIRDVRMIERAIRQNWKLDPSVFKDLPEELRKIAMDTEKSTRERLAAAKGLIAMNGQVLADAHANLPRRHEHLHADLRREVLERPAVLEDARLEAEKPDAAK